MDRRAFLRVTTMAAGLTRVSRVSAQAAAPGAAQGRSSGPPLQQFDEHAPPLVIERPRDGKPRAGQVVVAIQPHSDDIPLFAAGTVLKLLDEGAKGYVIRVTNDDMAGPGSHAETVMANWRDSEAVGKALGVERTFDLNYSNHMNGQHRVGRTPPALHLPFPPAQGRHRRDLRPWVRTRRTPIMR